MLAKASKGSAVVTLPTDTQILITRDFDAARHLVYRAFTTPDLISRWWSARRGVVTVADVDLRVGGQWRFAMRTDQGFDVAFHGAYREIVPNERLVYTEVYEAMPEGEALNTVTLAETNGVTRLTILVDHASKEVRDMVIKSGMEDGLQDALDLLEEAAISLA